MLIALSILCFVASLGVLHRSGFRFTGVQAHPLAILLWLQVFLMTVPGVVGIGLLDWPMSFGAEAWISAATRGRVVWSTFFSLAALFVLLAAGFGSGRLRPLRYQPSPGDARLLWRLTVVSYLVLAVKLATVSQIPLLLALQGDFVGAGEAKVRILQSTEGVTLFGLNYAARSLTHVVFLAAFLSWLHDRGDRARRRVLLANLPVALLNATYDVQKYTLVLLLVACSWLAYVKKGEVKHLGRGALIAIAASSLLFLVFLGEAAPEGGLLEIVVTRIFVSQAEGLFLIYEWIPQNLKYLWLGMPLAGALGLPQIDPAAEVVTLAFSGGDAWLNSNTYYIAHAATIFGDLALVLGPLFVFLNVYLVLRLAQPLVERRPSLYYPLTFWMVIRLPIVNIFTEFLWFKVVLDFLVNLGVLMALDWFLGRQPVAEGPSPRPGAEPIEEG